MDSSTLGTTEAAKMLSPKISLAIKKIPGTDTQLYPIELHCTLNDFLPQKMQSLEVSVNFWPFVSVKNNAEAFRYDDYGRFVINKSSMKKDGNDCFNIFEGPNIIIFRSRNYVGRESYPACADTSQS